MRSDRFRRRSAVAGDLTESIAEARSRRIWAGFFGVCGLGFVAAFVLAGLAIAAGPTRGAIVYGCGATVSMAIVLGMTMLSLRAGATAQQHERRSERLVLLVLLIGLASAGCMQGVAEAPGAQLGLWLPFATAFAILSASLMPWTVLQAAGATTPAFLLWIVLLFSIPHSSLDLFARAAIAVAGLVAAAVPLGIGFWTEQRFAEDEERAALSREVSHTRDELSRARIVHDAMFKPGLEGGPVEVSYRYDPLREIGGDFVHIVREPRSGRVTVTVIDVSGHGLAAALTVNRLFGELERVVAEARGDITPGAVMQQLNRYIYLTMSAHSMFATAACVQLDPDSREVRWVVAGHPPPLLRRKVGSVERLDCTTLVLGAAPPEGFDPDEQARPIGPGDCVILYTDGAFEARNPSGQRFGLRRLEESVAFDPPPRDFPTFLANLVARHHDGNPDDDLLVAQVTFKGGVRSVVAGAA
jgi:sigma-B regulation protein RsbU (phosphoserine phosphatase)